MSDSFEFLVTHQPSSEYCQLIWDIFCASRNRGISMERNFPWLLSASNDNYYVFCKENDALIGGLVLQRRHHPRIGCFGVIGLVCVKEEWRGKGIASALLQETIHLSSKINLSACTLWTRFPGVYAASGFELSKPGFSGVVKWFHHENTYSNGYEKESLSVLPPFAVSGWRVIFEQGSFKYVDNGSVATVVEWSGDVEFVVNAISNIFPEVFQVCLPRNDELIYFLRKKKAEIILDMTSNQMWLPLVPGQDFRRECDSIWIDLLDRI